MLFANMSAVTVLSLLKLKKQCSNERTEHACCKEDKQQLEQNFSKIYSGK